MKTKLILFTLLASINSIAATNGFVSVYNENEDKSSFGIKTEINLKENGLSLRADVKAKDYILKDFTINGSYMINKDLTVGVNSNNKLNAKLPSTQKIYLNGNYDRLKNISLEAGLTHTFESKTALKGISLNLGTQYEVSEDITLAGKVKFIQPLNKARLDFEKENGLFDKNMLYKQEREFNKFAQSYMLGVKYTGLKNLDIQINSYINKSNLVSTETRTITPAPTLEQLRKKYGSIRNLTPDKIHPKETVTNNITIKYFGINPKIKYMINDNIQITSDNKFYGRNEVKIVKDHPKSSYNHWYYNMDLNLAAKYTHEFNEMFSLSPRIELTSKTEIDRKKPSGFLFDNDRILTLGANADFKHSDNFEMGAGVDLNFNYNKSRYDNKFTYKNKGIKSNFNIKFSW